MSSRLGEKPKKKMGGKKKGGVGSQIRGALSG